MCQICAIKQLIARERWPKPLEDTNQDITFLADTIHNSWANHSKRKPEHPDEPVPHEILELLRLLGEFLEALQEQRSAWWMSPEKRALRKHLEDGGEQRKLSDLHKINNATMSNIESLNARLGVVCAVPPSFPSGVFDLHVGV
jgi:hypothetical protein